MTTRDPHSQSHGQSPSQGHGQSQSTSQPKPHTTTLWHHPTQQYGDKRMGNPAYVGRTPVHVIHNLLERYTREGDLVVDPFCGGGTTIDVALELNRKATGFDISPSRPDIERADARDLPLSDGVADFVFMDPPYSTHIQYSEEDGCIGELDAFEMGYFEAMAEAFSEAHRVLRDRRYFAVYVSDTFKKKKGFVPIGTHFMVMLAELFVPVDHICVVRGNKKLEDPRFSKVALEDNFYLRGFNHLLIFKKEDGSTPDIRDGSDSKGAVVKGRKRKHDSSGQGQRQQGGGQRDQRGGGRNDREGDGRRHYGDGGGGRHYGGGGGQRQQGDDRRRRWEGDGGGGGQRPNGDRDGGQRHGGGGQRGSEGGDPRREWRGPADGGQTRPPGGGSRRPRH